MHEVCIHACNLTRLCVFSLKLKALSNKLMDVLKDPREVYHPAEKMWSPKTPSNSNNAVETAKSASSSAEQADRERATCYHGPSARPAEVIANAVETAKSASSSAVHQCMYGGI